MPKAVSANASAEQGGEDPPRSSLLFPPQEIGSRQRSEVPAGEGAKEDGGLTTTAVTGHDAEIEELRQQVRALQAQTSAVQNSPVQDLSVQGSVVGQTRPGVIPSRDQSGLVGRAGLRSKAPGLRSKSPPSPPPGLTEVVQETSGLRDSEASNAEFLDESKSSPAYYEADKNIWEQSALSKVLQQMKDSEISKLKFTSAFHKPLEYEKWIKTVSTTMKGLHPEIGRYWRAVCTLAEKNYEKYLNDLSFTR